MTGARDDSLNEKLAALLLEREVEDLLVREAALLDEWQLDDWLDLFTEDARYIVPTTDMPTADPKETLAIINDNMARLRGRVERLKSRHAHREFPWSHTRRFVTNVRIKDINGEEIHVERVVSRVSNTERTCRSPYRELHLHTQAGCRIAQDRQPQSPVGFRSVETPRDVEHHFVSWNVDG